jgi:hypothetical protein
MRCTRSPTQVQMVRAPHGADERGRNYALVVAQAEAPAVTVIGRLSLSSSSLTTDLPPAGSAVSRSADLRATRAAAARQLPQLAPLDRRWAVSVPFGRATHPSTPCGIVGDPAGRGTRPVDRVRAVVHIEKRLVLRA